MYNNLSFKESILLHEMYLFSKLGVPSSEEKWADLGCGVGGPMRNAVLFGNDKITVYGVNNNETQIRRCKQLNDSMGLSDKAVITNSTFGSLPFADASMDKVYSIEATCHASDLSIPYKEAFRVLKPGGLFGCYEWVVTDIFKEDDAKMVNNLGLVQEGCSLVRLHTIKDCKNALAASGFQVIEMEDLALHAASQSTKERPWYFSLANEHGNPLVDTLTHVYHAVSGKAYVGILSVLEKLGLMELGSTDALKVLQKGGEGLANSGKMGIYTPMLYFLAKKPDEA